MDARTLAVLIVSLVVFGACGKPGPAEPAAPTPAASSPIAREAPAAETSFVNKVWAVRESQAVARGSLRVFLSDGTLLMTSIHETPALGSWRYSDGKLTIVEEGQEYPTDILALSDKTFRIRMHSPGEPVEILFEEAEHSSPAAAASAQQAAAAIQAAAVPAPAALWGTAWRLERLGNSGVLEGARATLEFPAEGRASGNGSCNRFNGVVTVDGDAIRFGGLAATRMACPEAILRQEEAYLAALRDAERYEADSNALRVFSSGRPEPLRFTATEATAPRANAQIERAPASTVSALNGVWSVTGYNIPGTSALTDSEARTRVGESLRLTDRVAVSAGDVCREPRYATRQVAAAEFLANEYRLAPDSLAPLATRNLLRIMDVSCGGARWNALGSTMIQLDRDHALSPWDGVFFELERDQDWRAVGQEPGWQLEIRQGAEMRFTYDYGKGTAVTPAAHGELDSRTGTRSYRATAEGKDLRVEIVPVGCSDAMSGRAFPATVTVTLNGRTFRGCGEALRTPFQG